MKLSIFQAEADEFEYEDILPEALTSDKVDAATKADILRQFAHWSDEEEEEGNDGDGEEREDVQEEEEESLADPMMPEEDPAEEMMVPGADLSEEEAQGRNLRVDEYGDDGDDDPVMDESRDVLVPVDALKSDVITYGRRRGVIRDEDGDGEPSSGDLMMTTHHVDDRAAESSDDPMRQTMVDEVAEAEESKPKVPRNPYDKNLKYRMQLMREEQAAKRSKVLVSLLKGTIFNIVMVEYFFGVV